MEAAEATPKCDGNLTKSLMAGVSKEYPKQNLFIQVAA
jgi:hypothetical protein